MRSFILQFLVLSAIALLSGTAGIAQVSSATITFDNRSGEPVLVKLIGPSKPQVNVPDQQRRTLNVPGGSYYIVTRHGASPDRYKYERGDLFHVTHTSTQHSVITITLHKVANGNYVSHMVSGDEFDNAAAIAGNMRPVLLSRYGDWGAYSVTTDGHKQCFAIVKPTSSRADPPNQLRAPASILVSSRPAEKVKDEVSIVIGYSFKPNTDASIEIGAARFAMFTRNDTAWIKIAAEQALALDAMRKGSDMIVKGTSDRGTQTTDTFSLKGLAQALDRVAQECK